MHNLTPITALGGQLAQVDTVGTVTCAEMPEVALVSFAARNGHLTKAKAALKKASGVAAPEVAQFATKDMTVFWTGPDQWLVEADYAGFETLAVDLAKGAHPHASVTEQSDAWTRFDVSGADVLAVLELLCNLDTRGMDVGAAQRSSIHHLGCFVLRRSDVQFSLYGPRASATSLHHAITSAMTAAL